MSKASDNTKAGMKNKYGESTPFCLMYVQQLRYTLKMIRTSDIFKFNYNGLFVPDTAATGNCNRQF